MSDHAKGVVGGSLGFVGALALLFIALKLMGYIAWGWWWILSPLWVPTALVLSMSISGLAVFLIHERLLDRWIAKKRAQP